MKTKDLLFAIFSVDGKLDYLSMLLAMCRDDRPTAGLLKAISLITDRDTTTEEYDGGRADDVTDATRYVPSPAETLYEALVVCLKNYMVIILIEWRSVAETGRGRTRKKFSSPVRLLSAV